ncbi:MAG: hypothetical protein IJT49_04820 [Clostridia bacterium]|nr:hypothetical protein [Clostridia bacterium]
MKKRLLSAVLLLVIIFSLAACDQNKPVTTDTETTADVTDVISGDQTTPDDTADTALTDTEAQTEEEDITDEEPVFYTGKEKDNIDIANTDFSKLDWNASVKTANELKNGVQGKFTDGARTGYTISNKNMSLTYHLLQNDKMIVNALTNSKGVPYFENTMDAYIRLENGDRYVASESLYSGRMNSQRLGYYYYDFHFRDQVFINPDTKKTYTEGEACIDVLQEYGDKFRGNDVKDLKCENGLLSYTVSTLVEPYIELKGISVSPDDYDAMQITVKADQSDILSVLLLVNGGGVYSPDRQLVHRFNAGEKTTMVIPFSAMKSLSGKITGFKVVLGTKSKEVVEIYEMKLLKRGGVRIPLLLERSYHTYPDKMHEQIRAVATDAYDGGGWLGTVTEIPVSTVRKMVLKGDGEEYNGIPDDFDFSKLEYVGFDIKGAGVFGIIMPSDQNGSVKVEIKDSKYVITHEVKIEGKLVQNGSAQVYHRIYTTDSHQFNDLRKEAYIERNPLKDIQLIKNQYGSKAFPYNKIRGCYDVFTTGEGFVDAYNQTPDRQIAVNIVATGDGVVDRTVYFNVYTASGALECAAVLDQDDSLLPVPVQVSKNFVGEKEESSYDPNDNSFGGEAYVPVAVGKDESRKFTVLHLYQNWGNKPLKQLSSISFVQPYYHLSIGVSETNCIAPYYVFGKDGWTLPDFRANSAPMWASQPQHTSTGRLYFLSYSTKTKGDIYMSESQSANIISSGPVYADIKMDYLSDDEAITATYRHTELPQTDENRTLYEIRMEVQKDVTIENFSKNFTIFKFDSRYASAIYKKISYVDENDQIVTEDVDTKRRISRFVKLGTDHPYVAVYQPNFKVPGSESTDAVNFALIIKDYDITIDGKKYEGNLVFRENALSGQTHIELTLDLENVTLKAGDKINIDMILLPWGETKSVNDDNVKAVREDTCVNPYKVDIKTGSLIEDTYIPMVKAENNTAEFTFSGGRNNGVVRVYGFTGYKLPDIKVKVENEWQPFELAGPNGYDGYQVYLDEDGTYSFAFALDMDANTSYELLIKQ